MRAEAESRPAGAAGRGNRQKGDGTRKPAESNRERALRPGVGGGTQPTLSVNLQGVRGGRAAAH